LVSHPKNGNESKEIIEQQQKAMTAQCRRALAWPNQDFKPYLASKHKPTTKPPPISNFGLEKTLQNKQNTTPKSKSSFATK
jgi:hypothetical protein